jgi:hypothetical protein
VKGKEREQKCRKGLTERKASEKKEKEGKTYK